MFHQPKLTSLLTLLCALLCTNSLLALQAEKRQFQAERVETAPKVDGVLDDPVWGLWEGGEKYFQLRPDNGEPASFDTEVKVIYTDFGIYFAAKMYDPEPNEIQRELGIRDELFRNADHFGVTIDTYNAGLNAFSFFVTAAGVQADLFNSGQREDRNWDAVWKSAVEIDEYGWNVEMEIPYSAIRFPKKDAHVWGINFKRRIQRKQEDSFWNFVDNSIEGFVNQSGQISGFEGIDPPVRLFFTPFVATTATHNTDGNSADATFSAGMDVKYGINESFTLDMSLIPDFSQVRSDNVVLNLSPFEVRFDENRPFFTEGTELFSKGRIFFSRRIGKSFGNVFDPEDTEELVGSTPSEAKLINSSKISGRTKGGLGIGFLNSMTAASYVTVRDTLTDVSRQVQYDPFTNFNVFVLDQNLKNNSKIGLINTNVTRANGGDNANVTGMDFAFFDKTNTYRVRGFTAISQKMSNNGDGTYSNDVGYRYSISAGKVSGKWQYRIGREVESDNYDINDLGFIRGANQISHSFNVSHQIFKPFWKLNRFRVGFGADHSQLYDPRVRTDWSVDINMGGQFKNFWNFNMGTGITPETTFDYFEPREDGYHFARPYDRWANAFLGTDNRKAFRIGGYRGFWRRPDWNQKEDWWGIFPRYRVNNKLTFNYEINYNKSRNDRGYATKLYDDDDNLQDIIFGLRNVQTVNNVVGAKYTFNNKMGINLRVRHNWTKVQYFDFFALQTDGELVDSDYTGLDEDGVSMHDANFNAFNVDLVYTWQIGPGSFVNIVWKDSIINSTSQVQNGFFKNFENTITSDQINSFSFKIIYFIDYLSIKNRI